MRRFFRDERGQATVEFAVTLPIYLVLFLGVIYFGKAYYKEQQVQIEQHKAELQAERERNNRQQALIKELFRRTKMLEKSIR